MKRVRTIVPENTSIETITLHLVIIKNMIEKHYKLIQYKAYIFTF